MTEPGGGGDRLEVSVVADATGFARDAQAKIKAELARERVLAKIRADLDYTRLQAQAKAAARRVGKDNRVTLAVGVDGQHLTRELDTAVASAVAEVSRRNHTVRVKIEADRSALEEALRQAAKATPSIGGRGAGSGAGGGGGGGGGSTRARVEVEADLTAAEAALARLVAKAEASPATVDVDADTADARAEVERLRQEVKRTPIDVTVRVDSEELRRGGRGIRILTQNMNGLQKFGFYAGLVQVFSTAVVGAAGGLLAMAGAAGSAIGVLGALPNAIGVAGQGVGALLLSFGGISDAVSAMGKAQKGAASGAKTTAAAAKRVADARKAAAKEQVAATKRVADATKAVDRAQTAADRTAASGAKAVTEARRRVADTVARATGRIADGEDRVAAAQKKAERAQAALNRAREEATERLSDYQLQLARAALDEEGATLAVERARQRWNETMRDPISTRLDRDEADLALREAEQSLAEIRERNADLAAEAAQAAEAGVEGSEEVAAANERLADAVGAVAEAEADLDEARTDGARDVADARADLAETIADADQDNLDAALRVTDAQAELAETIAENADRAAEAQAAIAEAIAAVREAASASSPAVDELAAAMAKLSPEGRAFATFVNDVLKPRMLEFRNAVQAQVLPGVQDLLTAVMTDVDPNSGLGSYLDVLQTGMVDSGAIVATFARDLGTLMSSEAFKADTATIMESNNVALGNFAGAGLAVVDILRRLAVAAGPIIEEFSELVEAWAVSRAEALSSAEGQQALADKLERAWEKAKQLARIAENLLSALKNMGLAGQEEGDRLLDVFERLTAKWESWTGSTEGQERMGEFFEAMGPVAEDLGTVLGTLTETFVLLGENGGGALSGILTTINYLLEGLNWLLATPVGPWLSGFMAFAGVMSVLSLLYRWLRRIGDRLASIPRGAKKAADALKGVRGSGGGEDDDSGTPSRRRRGRGRATRDREGDEGDEGDSSSTDRGEDNTARPDRDQDDTRGRRRRRGRRRGRRGDSEPEEETEDSGEDAEEDTPRGRRRGLRERVRGRVAELRRNPERGSVALGRTRADEDADFDRWEDEMGDDGGARRPRRRGRRGAAVAAGGAGVAGGVLANGDMSAFGPGAEKAMSVATSAVDKFAGAAARTVSGFVNDAAADFSRWAGVDVTGAATLATGALTSFASTSGDNLVTMVGNKLIAVADGFGATGDAAAELGDGLDETGRKATDAGNKVDDAGNKGRGLGTKFTDAAASVGSKARDIAGAAVGVVTDFGKMAVAAGINAAKVVGGWVLMGAQSLVQAGRMALAWVIAMGPIALVIAAVIGLVALVIANWDTVKEWTVKAWDAVVAGVRQAWDWIVDKVRWAFDLLKSWFLNWTLPGLIIKHWDTIKEKVAAAAGWVRDKVVAAFQWISDKVTGAAGWVRDKTVAAFQMLSDKVTGAAGWVRDKTVGAFEWCRDRVVAAFQWISDRVSGGFGWLRDMLVGAATWVRDKIVGAFEGARDKAVAAFQWISDRATSIWTGLRDLLATPIRGIVDLVYNNGIRKVYNWINDLWGGADWPELRFARGGTVPGYAPGRDRVHALLSPGEGVLVPEAVRGLGGAHAVQAINSAYSARVPAPSAGGRARVRAASAPRADDPDQSLTQHFFLGGVVDWIGDRIGNLQDLAASGWRYAVEAAIGPVRSGLGAALPGGALAGNLRTGAHRWLDKLAEAVSGRESAGGAGGQSTGSGWMWLRDVVQAAIPQARVNSAVRNTPDAHGRGKAVDFGYGSGPGGAGSAGLASIARLLHSRYGKSLYELIYTGVGAKPGGYQVKRGRDMTYDAATQRAHTNHVHAAVYDRGGRFRAGTVGLNTSGRDEGVLTARGMAALGGWARLDALNAGQPLAQLVGAAAGGMTAEAGGRIGNYFAEGAIQQTVHNPRPETAGDTLSARMRRLQAVGVFGVDRRG